MMMTVQVLKIKFKINNKTKSMNKLLYHKQKHHMIKLLCHQKYQ